MKVSKKIIQEAIRQEVMKENPLAGAIASVKGAAAGVKGTFQNMGANYRLSNVGSQMDQFAKKSQKAWDVNSSKAKKQIDKMMGSKNQDVAAAAQTVGQQLTQADQQVAQALDFVSNNVARTMIAAGGSSPRSMGQNVPVGSIGMEKTLSSKGIYPKMIGKKEYLQVVDLMQKIMQIGGTQSIQNFEREMIKKGVRPDRLGKREYGVEVINHLENEYLRALAAQQQQAVQGPQGQQGQSVPSFGQTQNPQSPNLAQTGLRPRPSFSNAPQSSTSQAAAPAAAPSPTAPNLAPADQHQHIQPTKRGYGVDRRFSSNEDPSNPAPKNFGSTQQQSPASMQSATQAAVSQAATGGEDSKDFENVVGNIQSSPAFKRNKSWKGKSSNLFPKVDQDDSQELPPPQEEYEYSSQYEPVKTGVRGDTEKIHNVSGIDPQRQYFNKGKSQAVSSKHFSKSDLSQENPRYSPYSATGEPLQEPIPLTRKKEKVAPTPPPIPADARKKKYPKVSKSAEKSVEKVLGEPKKKKQESDISLYYKMLQKAEKQGKQLKPNELADLKAWRAKKRKAQRQKK